MGYFNEKNFIQNNILNHQDRLQSQVARFLDTAPTYVTFYDINTIESTVNSGTLSVDKLWGPDSPIRFNGVRNLPVYGVEPINPDLELNDEGVNVRYEGEGILLPHTVRAKPNSFFTMDVLPRRFVFRVTSINETTINSNSYLRLSYELYATDEVVTDYLDKQTVMWYRCVPENIGTENMVLMLDADLEKIELLKNIIEKNIEYYKMFFYDKRYNSFLFNRDDGFRIYDRLLTRFMIDTGIFRKSKEFWSIVLTEEDDSNDIPLEYYTSIFNAVVERDISYLEHRKYFPMVGLSSQSSFHHWRDRSVVMTRTGIGQDDYIRPELVDLLLHAEKCVKDHEDKCKNINNDDVGGGGYIEIPDIENKPIYVSPDPVPVDPYFIESATVKVTVDAVGNTVDVEPVVRYKRSKLEDTPITVIPSKNGNGLSFDELFGEDEEEPVTPIEPPIKVEPVPSITYKKSPIQLSDGKSIEFISNSPVLSTEFNGVKKTEPLDPRADKVMLLENIVMEDIPLIPLKPSVSIPLVPLEPSSNIVYEDIPVLPKPVEVTLHTGKTLLTYVPPNEIAEGENIMINTIIMYFGDCEITLDQETVDELMKPHRYIKNNHESFLLTPIFLYILQRLLATLTTGTIL